MRAMLRLGKALTSYNLVEKQDGGGLSPHNNTSGVELKGGKGGEMEGGGKRGRVGGRSAEDSKQCRETV